jgi:hypothetical protein
MARWRLLLLLLLFACCWPSSAAGAEIAPERARLFQPPKRPSLPGVKNAAWVRNPVDAFILAELEAKGLTPNAPAGKLRLLRRVSVDLTGLPPTIAEQDAFLADASPDAYDKVVDRLLVSPRYGERWAQHWLDLVRFAETDGFKADDYRPDAHKYRDYVIRALNTDLPYHRFIRQQLAGDELEPDNPDAIVATGFNRLWPDEYNAANLEQRRQEILDDQTETTALAFLGLTFGCARCHDHKYDPTAQTDYFRFQAFFAAMHSDNPAVFEPSARRDYETKLTAWEKATKEIRDEMETLIAGPREELRKGAMTKFRPEIQEAITTADDKRTPYQRQIALMAEPQLARPTKDMMKKLPETKRKRYEELETRLAAIPRPVAPHAMAVSDLRQAPPTHLLQAGNWFKPLQELSPAFPDFLGGGRVDTSLGERVQSAGRRAALARWLTRRDNPLTARVLVNRLWQHHFGAGLVATANDFGMQGDLPTHPDLLDWLAVEFMDRGWSVKEIHRLMVTSAAYRQDSRVDATNPDHVRAASVDPGNRLLWHARRRRLEGEAVRDGILALAGELNDRMFGYSARPKLPDKVSNYAWKPDASAADQKRRSVYVFVKRNMRYPLFDAFDWPDLHNSCSRRVNTTTAPQALLLLNGELASENAQAWSARLVARHGTDDQALVAHAYRAAWGRAGTADEVRIGVRFVAAQAERLRERGAGGKSMTAAEARAAAIADFCHALLNTNEFLYVD